MLSDRALKLTENHFFGLQGKAFLSELATVSFADRCSSCGWSSTYFRNDFTASLRFMPSGRQMSELPANDRACANPAIYPTQNPTCVYLSLLSAGTDCRAVSWAYNRHEDAKPSVVSMALDCALRSTGTTTKAAIVNIAVLFTFHPLPLGLLRCNCPEIRTVDAGCSGS